MRWVGGAAGCLFVAGAGCILNFEATAGQLSFAPSINVAADDDSNRNLTSEGAASQSATVQVSADFKGSTETTEFSLSPLVRYQAFNSRALANVFERDVRLTDAWTHERGNLTLTGADSDQSTLTTEATQTGILSSQLHQRLHQGAISASYEQTERISLIATGSYTDVSYYGTPNSFLLNLLSGYRYPSGSIGEQFQLSETSTLLANISYSKTLSRLPGLDSRSMGGDLEYHRALSETFDLSASIGASQARSASTQHVTTGGLSLTHNYAFGTMALSYTRSLTPQGTGNLVQRQVFAVSASRALTDLLDVTLLVSRVQNSQLGIPPQSAQLPQVQAYNNAQLLFSWQFAEYWRLNADIGAIRTQTPGPVSLNAHAWSTGLSLTWSPRPRTSEF